MFRNVLFIFVAAITAAAPVPLTADDRSPRSSESKNQFADLIRELGANLQKDRDRAERELLKHEEAIPELRKSIHSKDPEIARRAAQVLKKLLINRFQRQIKVEGVDLFAERFLFVNDSFEREAGWQAIIDFAHMLLSTEGRDYRKIDRNKLRIQLEFSKWAESQERLNEITKPDETVEINSMGTNLIRAKIVSVTMPGGGMFISSGGIRGPHLIGSLVVTGDSVNVDNVSNSIIICDGDLNGNSIGHSIVIARGKVSVGWPSGFSLIVCSGPFKSRRQSPAPPTTVKDNTPNLLGLVKFFETSQVGIEVTGADGGVKVTKASDGKPFARAGIKPNDVILSMGGSAAGSPDAFRRLLRKKVALHQPAVLKVRRDGKDIEITVPFAE